MGGIAKSEGGCGDGGKGQAHRADRKAIVSRFAAVGALLSIKRERVGFFFRE